MDFIKGIQKTTLVDYPGKVACTFFLCKCSFRCPFCYNRDLVLNYKTIPEIKEDEILDFLKERKKWLDGVCITGGEPTVHGKRLADFIEKVKKLEYLVKLDTNGSNPKILRELINKKLIDYIAMDVKNSLENYDKSSGIKVNIKNIKESIGMIKNNSIDYEFRITAVPALHTKEDMENIGKLLKGSKRFFIQQFKPLTTINKEFEKIEPFPVETLKEFKKILEKYINKVEIRNL